MEPDKIEFVRRVLGSLKWNLDDLHFITSLKEQKLRVQKYQEASVIREVEKEIIKEVDKTI